MEPLTMKQIDSFTNEQIMSLTMDQLNDLPVLPISIRILMSLTSPEMVAEQLIALTEQQLLEYPACAISAFTDTQLAVLPADLLEQFSAKIASGRAVLQQMYLSKTD